MNKLSYLWQYQQCIFAQKSSNHGGLRYNQYLNKRKSIVIYLSVSQEDSCLHIEWQDQYNGIRDFSKEWKINVLYAPEYKTRNNSLMNILCDFAFDIISINIKIQFKRNMALDNISKLQIYSFIIIIKFLKLMALGRKIIILHFLIYKQMLSRRLSWLQWRHEWPHQLHFLQG